MCPKAYQSVKAINLWSEDEIVPGLQVPNDFPDSDHTSNRMQLSIDRFMRYIYAGIYQMYNI